MVSTVISCLLPYELWVWFLSITGIIRFPLCKNTIIKYFIVSSIHICYYMLYILYFSEPYIFILLPCFIIHTFTVLMKEKYLELWNFKVMWSVIPILTMLLKINWHIVSNTLCELTVMISIILISFVQNFIFSLLINVILL